MNLRLNIILIVIVAVLAGWYFKLKITTSVYDKSGNLQYEAQADKVENYEETGKVELANPLLNLFGGITSLKEWQITALDAEIDKNKMLHLVGSVKIDSLNPESKLQHIETEELLVDLNTQDISTDKEIIALGVGFNTKGQGLEGNLKSQVAKLKTNVKTHIELTKIKQNK